MAKPTGQTKPNGEKKEANEALIMLILFVVAVIAAFLIVCYG